MSIELASFLKLLLAMVLGFAIGIERKMRFKEAGIRTHTIVGIGSCLFMIISQHGFNGADTARVAAQIVSGIGFIGAGMIFYHKEVVHGLTTAAGIWATAAIGMAVGAGMYVIALIASALIIVVQFILHLNIKFFKPKMVLKLNVVFTVTGDEEREIVKGIFDVKRFTKINAKKEGDQVVFTALITTDKAITDADIYDAMTKYDFIQSISRKDDE